MEKQTKRTVQSAASYVKNKDIPKLTRIPAVMTEIVQLENRQEWIHERMFNITKAISGVPGGGKGGGYDTALAELSEMDEKYSQQIHAYTMEMREAEDILNVIQDATIRAFVLLLYLCDRSKNQTMRELRLTEWEFRKLKRAIEGAPDMAHVPKKVIRQGDFEKNSGNFQKHLDSHPLTW